MLNGIQREEKATNHIENLLDTIELYLNAEKYTFDYARVEHLLEQAVQTVEQTARGVRPANLPDDIPFSDSLGEEGQSSPYNYKGDMSPEEYERMMELYEKDHQKDSAETTKTRQTQGPEQPEHTPAVAAEDDPRVITVYQSPDRRHCALLQIENDGEYDDTGMPGRRYFLPDGFHVQYGPICMPRIINSEGCVAYLIDSDSGYPYLHTIDSDTGHISQNDIPLRPYSESPAELWDEYNTMLNAIDYNYRHGRLGADYNGTTFRFAITDCEKIIDGLYEKYVQNPGDKNVKDELAYKHEQRKWLEKEMQSFNQTEQSTSPSSLTSAEEPENGDHYESAAEDTLEQEMMM